VHSHAEIAALIEAETGTPVRYTSIPAGQWQRELEALAHNGTELSVNSAMAQHISAIGAVFSQLPSAPPVDTTALAEAIGRSPQTFAEFVREHGHQFVAAPSR
jgi:hypothetical protein